jgi:hypothetical protein
MRKRLSRALSGAVSVLLFAAIGPVSGSSAALALTGANTDRAADLAALRLTDRVTSLTSADRGPVVGAEHRGRDAIELRVPDPEVLKSAKAEAARDVRPGGRRDDEAPGAGPRAVVFNGLNQPGIPAQDSSPADTTGAVGPHDYIEMVNTVIRIYGRDLTTVQASMSLGDFIGFPTDIVFDPQIQWDQQGQRYLFVMDDVEGPGSNFLAFGWSTTANPSNLTTDWCTYFIDTGAQLHDYPKLGHNDNHMLLGTNVFSDSTGDFLGARLWAIPKPAIGSTTCPPPPSAFLSGPLTTTDGDSAFTPVPANTFGASANGFVVASDLLTGDSELMVWHVSGPAGTPSLTPDGEIGVSTYDIPANVPQPGTSNVLDSLDSRLTQAVAAPDPDAAGAMAVWTQHTIDGPGGRSVVRWYELVPGAGTPLRQEGAISNPSHFVFNGAISPAASGSDAVIHYNVGSATLAAEIRAQSRTGATALGAMVGEITLGTSAASNQDFTCTPPNGPPCRWGDYAGASPDPNNDHVVWGSNQANGPFTTDPHWVTRNFAIAPPAAPALGLLRVTTSPAVPSQILVDGVPRDTWGLNWVKLPPGTYTVRFTHVEGYTEPDPQTVNVTTGNTTTVDGTFTQRGTLRVTTSPAVAGTISVDGIPRDDWGVWTDLPTGGHQVCFGAVEGYDPPPCQQVTLTAGQQTTVTGNYTANPGAPGPSGVGLLRVTTSPAVPSQILVDGVPRDTWGLNWVKLPPGTYTVRFTHVEGYTEPDPQTVNVTAGDTTTVDGTFTQRGTLRVTTSPAVAGTISVDGIPRDDWGVWTDLPTGSHQVCFGAVQGYTAPPCQNITLTAGQQTTVNGTYT